MIFDTATIHRLARIVLARTCCRALWAFALSVVTSLDMAHAADAALPGIILEAESGALTAPYVVEGGFINQHVQTSDTATAGTATYTFSVSENDNYIVRLSIDTTQSYNFLWVALDGETPTKIMNFPVTSGVEERNALWSLTHSTAIHPLNAGTHTLRIFGGRENVKIDKIRIVKMTDLFRATDSPATVYSAPLSILISDLSNQLKDHPSWMDYQNYYMGWLYENIGNLDGVINLPQTITPGRYYVFVKAVGTPYRISLGDVNSALVTPTTDNFSGSWQRIGPLDVSTATSTLIVTATKSVPLSTRAQFQLYGIYITTNEQSRISGADQVIDFTYPTVMDDSPAIKGNLIDNSSFEVGVDANWGIEKKFQLRSLLDTTTAHSGNNSIKFPLAPWGRFTSRIYHLTPNKKYTFSAWVKTAPGKKITPYIGMSNVFIPPDGTAHGQVSYIFGNGAGAIEVRDTWQRISVTGYAVAYPTSDYTFWINLSGGTTVSADDALWIDDVQLEEGTLSDYAPSRLLTVQVSSPQMSNLYSENEQIIGNLDSVNSSEYPLSAKMLYKIYDYQNNLIRQGETLVTLAPHEQQSQNFDLSTGRRGSFRLVYWLEGNSNQEKELTYSVIPQMSADPDATSYIGIHADCIASELGVIKKMGVKWTRALSPCAEPFRWKIIKPTKDGPYLWQDAPVQLAHSYGIEIMATLVNAPDWALTGGLPNLDDWQDYVYQTVHHYQSWVHTWEIWNEPNQAPIPPDYYAQMLKRAVDAIESTDPTAKIVAMGGTSYQYMQSVVASIETLYPGWLWKDHVTGLSAHAYPNGYPPEPYKTNVIDPYAKPLWNTEAGAWDLGGYQGPYSNFVTWGPGVYPKDNERFYKGAITAVENTVNNFIRSIGSGMTKYFYYDSRIGATGPGITSTHSSIFEYDQSIRPKGIAYVIASYFIDHGKTLGDVSNNSSVYVHVFDVAGKGVAAVWTKDNSNKLLSLSSSIGDLKVFDIMGNEVAATSTIPLSRSVKYLRSEGTSGEALAQILHNSTISNRSDTVPPQLVVLDAPHSRVNNGTLRIRWLAIDETSVPGSSTLDPEALSMDSSPDPFAIQYRYHLVGRDDWTSWGNDVFHDYKNLSNGHYIFEVQAKDKSGNISVAQSDFDVGTATLPAVPAKLRLAGQ